MKKHIVMIFCIISVFFLTGCSSHDTNPSTFGVKYYAKHSSSGGDRILDIIYTVTDGEIRSCEGTYSYPLSSEQREEGNFDNNMESCDVNKLRAKEYNVPQNYITKNDVKTGSESVPPGGRYVWEILD